MKIYLLGGNGSTTEWWNSSLPYFKKFEPSPVELPGFGRNHSNAFGSINELAEALISQTEAGQRIFAVGINSLVVLHALTRRPDHFSQVILLAPVGAFMWENSLARVMSIAVFRKAVPLFVKKFPLLLKWKFAHHRWDKETWHLVNEGYRQCRAFSKYFEVFRRHNALQLFDRIEEKIEIIWGIHDNVVPISQLPAWEAILPRAKLWMTIKEDWSHYPYLDDPKEFVEFIEGHSNGFAAHTKGGRLSLARLAGLPVPVFLTVNAQNWGKLVPFLEDHTNVLAWAVRSSALQEDMPDSSHAGLFKTFLRVPKNEVLGKAKELLTAGTDEIVVQEFLEPRISGVSFVRNLSIDTEYVEGHLEEMINGKVLPKSLVTSRLRGDEFLEVKPQSREFPMQKFQSFLMTVMRAFHFQHSDIEWAWDGRHFYLFQIRPVTVYGWRRCLTSANLDEILPEQVSKLMEHAQRSAAPTVSRILALWDQRVLEDGEPFTAVYQDASYINMDLFLSRFKDWGLPTSLIAESIGGNVPRIPISPLRFLRTIPMLMRMLFLCRREILSGGQLLKGYEAELDLILASCLPLKRREQMLVTWFVRYYSAIVKYNILLNIAIVTNKGSWLGRPSPFYSRMDTKNFPHRVPYESDPATPRHQGQEKQLVPQPHWGLGVRFWNKVGLLGMGGKYIELREWFRDNNMRLFHRLHNALEGSVWLGPHEGVRTRKGTFWENGDDIQGEAHAFVIYPGTVEGRVGYEVIIVDALDPGQYEFYISARAVVARCGGRLSHGAILLRELKKPSAIIPECPFLPDGTQIRFSNGSIEKVNFATE